MKNLKLALLLFVTIGAYLGIKANDNTYNIRQISNRDGLSNSAVICLLQDKDRHLWIGTYDGLNKYNGTDIQVYKPDIKNPHSISGNVIRRIVESKNDYLWIMTKGGLNKYSKKRNRVEAYLEEFREDSSIACDSHGNFFILPQNGYLYYYDFDLQKVRKINIPNLKFTNGWAGLIIDTNDKVWITHDGVIRQYELKYSKNNKIELVWIGNFNHSQYITHIYYDKGTIIFVDRKGDLYYIESDNKELVRNIQPLIKEYGIISSILFDGRDIIIGFNTSGVIRLNRKKGYVEEKIPINCGVFSLFKDDVQNILWVGTDGQGVYACAHDDYIFNGINLEELPLKSQRPIRAIFSDHHGDLWLGTKGNGIIKIEDYANATEYNWQNVKHLSTQNGLSNNAVFAFKMSRFNNVLWIGSSGPDINFYSFADRKIHTLKNNSSIPFAEVHNIIETSDTTLWVSSQLSMLKVSIRKNGNKIETNNIRRYRFDIKNKQLYNKIYSICQENDSIMWLAVRGNGAIRFNNSNGNYRLVTFDEAGITPMNDVLSIHMDKNHTLWFGSSYGISSQKELPYGNFIHQNYNENDGLLNNTIHGILENHNGKLWFSSNTGLILFDPATKSVQNFNQKSGLKVIEFSDNAYFKDDETSRLFFGGIDGVVWIEQGENNNNNFIPPVSFTKLRVQNQDVDMHSFLFKEGKEEYLQLNHNQNFFTISFSANDFDKGTNRNFSYILEDFSEVWMNTNSREAQFTNIPPGKYVLKVKYGNESEKNGQIASLTIIVLPPWYLSIYAKLIYTFIILGLLFFIYMYVVKRNEKKRIKMARQLDQKYKEEMYENKLRFFTNITHEFCTPLTLIHTPSERLLNYEKGDGFVKKYANVIKTNAERLNNLIQEIIDFRRMETGHKIVKIEKHNINEICSEIMNAFTDLGQENNIKFSLDIEDSIEWNTDRSCIVTILNNLVSNGFKYTPVNGCIYISVKIKHEELVLKVYNSGKGIREEDIPLLFSRYSVLDNVKENSIKGLSSRNGLGLAISKSMTELLEGKIEVKSKYGEYAEFIVRLPHLDLEKTLIAEAIVSKKSEIQVDSNNINRHPYKSDSAIDTLDESIAENSDQRSRILIVDDNEEILWMLKDILSEDYFIITAKDGVEGLEQLINYMPDLVITDIMMPNQDGFSLTKQIKTNPHTSHIPIVIISVKSAIDCRIEGLESGADAYVSKPFDIQLLITVVKQLIEKHKKLKEYYNSAASSFNYINGQLLSTEDRDFVQTLIRIVDQNINDVEFSPEDLADSLSLSLRSLYRRLKDLGLLPPKDFIKKQRIEYSAKLLLTTNLTIQEIMYSVGFTTRSHFYKEFTRRYSQSPSEYRERK